MVLHSRCVAVFLARVRALLSKHNLLRVCVFTSASHHLRVACVWQSHLLGAAGVARYLLLNMSVWLLVAVYQSWNRCFISLSFAGNMWHGHDFLEYHSDRVLKQANNIFESEDPLCSCLAIPAPSLLTGAAGSLASLGETGSQTPGAAIRTH